MSYELENYEIKMQVGFFLAFWLKPLLPNFFEPVKDIFPLVLELAVQLGNLEKVAILGSVCSAMWGRADDKHQNISERIVQ